MRAVIVASGPSAKNFFPPDGVTVIAVNGAIDWLGPVADYWFSLDLSDANLERLHNPVAGVQYCAAVPRDYSRLPDHVRRFHRIAKRGVEPFVPQSPEWWCWRWSAVRTLSEYEDCIHTGNSAWGALGLAYILGAKRVALVGVDADGQPRVEGGRPGNLSHLPMLFESALGQIDLVNCGAMTSRVPKLSIAEGMQWLTA